MRASDSSPMFRPATAHSSLVSIISAPTRRKMAVPLGKIPTKSERRLVSLFTHWRGLIELICAQCSRGKTM